MQQQKLQFVIAMNWVHSQPMSPHVVRIIVFAIVAMKWKEKELLKKLRTGLDKLNIRYATYYFPNSYEIQGIQLSFRVDSISMMKTHYSATVTGQRIPVITNISPRAVLVLMILIQLQKNSIQNVMVVLTQLNHPNHLQLLNGLNGVLTPFAVQAVVMELNLEQERVL